MQQGPTIPQPGRSYKWPVDEEPVKSGSSRGHEGWRSILSTIIILAAAPLVAWLMITFIFQSYEVDGLSMEQTLQDKDRLIVLKTGKTWAKITNSTYIPRRGEIIIFQKSGLREFGTPQDKQLIKRVIGVPGDRVVYKNGKFTVYNTENPKGYNPDDNTEYSNLISRGPGEIDVVVNEGEVFVAGDNRANSMDSRSFGPIKSTDIIGELAFRLFPVNKVEAY